MTHQTVAVSQQLVDALRRHRDRAYRIAFRAGLHPTTLSKLIHGATRVQPNDARVLAVGRELGLSPAECFQDAAPVPIAKVS